MREHAASIDHVPGSPIANGHPVERELEQPPDQAGLAGLGSRALPSPGVQIAASAAAEPRRNVLTPRRMLALQRSVGNRVIADILGPKAKSPRAAPAVVQRDGWTNPIATLKDDARSSPTA
jgi:hypothetical protein